MSKSARYKTSFINYMSQSPEWYDNSDQFGKALARYNAQHPVADTLSPIHGILLVAPTWPTATIQSIVMGIAEADAQLVAFKQLQRDESKEKRDVRSECWLLSCQCRSAADLAPLRALATTVQEAVDILILPSNIGPIRFACFDMDSTLIQIEVIDELAKRANVGEHVSGITLRAMRGEIDFDQSFTERMRLLKGLPALEVSEIERTLPLMSGAKQLFAGLQKRNIRSAIFSGGFDVFAKKLAEDLGIDHVHANTLAIHKQQLTGEVAHPIVNGERKKMLLEDYIAHYSLGREHTLAVGDGANDLPMLLTAGIGVAFHAKPLVQERANFGFKYADLSALLYVIDACALIENNATS